MPFHHKARCPRSLCRPSSGASRLSTFVGHFRKPLLFVTAA